MPLTDKEIVAEIKREAEHRFISAGAGNTLFSSSD